MYQINWLNVLRRMYRDSVHSLEMCFECTRPLDCMYGGECTEIQYIRWRCVLNVPDQLVECYEGLGECTEIQYIRWRCLLNVPDNLVECTEANVPRFSTFTGDVF